MRDIAEWFVDAAAATGRHERAGHRRAAEHRRLDQSRRRAPRVLRAPHGAALDLQRAAAASICVGTEQPGTPWFRLTVDACRRGLRVARHQPAGSRRPPRRRHRRTPRAARRSGVDDVTSRRRRSGRPARRRVVHGRPRRPSRRSVGRAQRLDCTAAARTSGSSSSIGQCRRPRPGSSSGGTSTTSSRRRRSW